MDKIDKETRSRVMSCVKSKNTTPEMRVRSVAHKLGFRFRLHRKDLPGSPDIVFPSRHVALFVHGCFWHGHNCSHGKRHPATNTDYWNDKLKRNKKRDKKVHAELISMGWKPIVIWECEANLNDLSALITKLLNNG